MSRPKKEYYKTEIIVSGRGRFPVDMLRYDLCCPFNSDTLSVLSGEYIKDTVEVRLVRFSTDGGPCTKDRWASFGWIVVYDTGSLERRS